MPVRLDEGLVSGHFRPGDSPGIPLHRDAFMPLLTTLIFLPMAGAIFLALTGGKMGGRVVRWTAFGVAAADLALALCAMVRYDLGLGGYQFVEMFPWIAGASINYHLGMDGLSLLLVLLTAGLGIIAIAASFSSITERETEFYVFLLALQTGILGTFLALDLILFYVFWELMLLPLYFLIGIYGSERRIYAAIKFVLFTLVGSVLMLIGILVVHYKVLAATGTSTFSAIELAKHAPGLESGLQIWLFLSLFLAFAIKAPLFPFHTWLPDAHTEAPTAGSIILAGVLLKTGVYGMIRFCIPFFPYGAITLAPVICWLSVIAIIYGALTAMAQKDMKRLVAYSSVSHMGFVILGIFAFTFYGFQGGALQMLNHGISTGGLFLCVGILYERRHTRLMADYGGIYPYMRNFAVLTVIIVLSSAGLPGLNGFVGEFLVLLGSWEARFVSGPMHIYSILAATGVILGAVYLLIMVQRVFFGPCVHPVNETLLPLRIREKCLLLSLVLAAFFVGLYPKPFLAYLKPTSIKTIRIVTNYDMNHDIARLESSPDSQ